MKNEKTVTPEVKKTWNTPELELIDIRSGTEPGGTEGKATAFKTADYDGVS